MNLFGELWKREGNYSKYSKKSKYNRCFLEYDEIIGEHLVTTPPHPSPSTAAPRMGRCDRWQMLAVIEFQNRLINVSRLAFDTTLSNMARKKKRCSRLEVLLKGQRC